MNDIVPAYKVPQFSAFALIRISGFRIDPPVYEPRHPAFPIRVAGCPDIGFHPAGRSVSGEHIEELALCKMHKLIKH